MMERLNDILQIPERCLLNRKLPKTFFKKNFDLTATEKRMLDDVNTVVGIEWLAVVNPANANVNSYEEGHFVYEEIQVMSLQTSAKDFDKNVPRLAELVQKHIPYHMLLCIYHGDTLVLNACDKRINQNDNTRRTIEQRYFSEQIDLTAPKDTQVSFMDSLAFGRLDKINLKTYYDGYSQSITALQAAAYVGAYVPRTRERSDVDLQTLQRMQTLQNEIATLQAQSKKAMQLNEQVAINLQVQERRKQIEHLKTLITI
jgi:hypothetical protein